MLRTLLRSAILLLALGRPALAETVTVFAAASLRDALGAVADAFEGRTGHAVTVSYAGSSVLARQIGFGAPADVFLSANTDWMDWLEARGAIAPDRRVPLLTNTLVLVASKPVVLDDIADLPAALGDGRLAMALVDAVPAGLYGKAALTDLGLWDRLAPQVVQTDNVRAALALVALGEAAFGVVYATDAQAEPRVSLAARFPEDSHPPIVYPAVRLTEGDAARAFMAFLQGEEAAAVFARFGFGTAASE